MLKATFALVTKTMYHLYLGLAHVNGQRISMKKVLRRKIIVCTLFWVTVTLLVPLTIVNIVSAKNLGWMAYVDLAFYIYLFACYSFVICKLRVEINKLQGMGQERKKVYCQSLTFLITFFCGIFLVFSLHQENAINSAFWEILFTSLGSFFAKTIPIFTIMHAHNLAFKDEKILAKFIQ